MSTPQTNTDTNKAQKAISDLLGGGQPNGTTPDELGTFWPAYQALSDAYMQGGTAAARTVWTALCANNPALISLVAGGATDLSETDHEGHAQAVLRQFPARIAYNAAFGFLWYTGTHWERDGAEAAVTRAIVETLQIRAAAAVQVRISLTKFSCDSGRIAGILKMLQSLTTTPATMFDGDPNLLNCQNGVLNLRDLSITPHDAAQHFTYCLQTPYLADADTLTEYTDLKRILSDLTPDVVYLQIAGGYSMTGHTSEEILFYLLGPGRSGKGTVTESALTLFGRPLATETSFETFATERKGNDQNFDLAPLRPCRLVFASESERHAQLNAARVKRLTGGNFIHCAFKYGDSFTYRPQFKLWLSSNFSPAIDPDDDAAWGRVRMLRFPNSHLENADASIKARLKEPAYQMALLHWLADGAAIWYDTGLPGRNTAEGNAVLMQTKAERDAQDTIAQFVEECLKTEGTTNADRLKSTEIYQAYEQWCHNNGAKPKYINQFTQSLKAKKFTYLHGTDFRGFVGVRLK